MVPAKAPRYGASHCEPNPPVRQPASPPSVRDPCPGGDRCAEHHREPGAVAAPSGRVGIAVGAGAPGVHGTLRRPAQARTSHRRRPRRRSHPHGSPCRPLQAARSVERPTTALLLSADEATRKALTTRLGTLRATYGLPGVSAAILFPDGTMWRATSGFADVAAKRRLTADTEFAVASISKTFLAALILVLVDEGKLSLDAPVAPYLPGVELDPAITVRQLLDHTSGLHDYFYDPDIDEALLADRKRVWTPEEALAYVGKPYFEPSAGWHYSNTNYVILGLLAETIEGAPLPTQLRTRFLAPLGLDRHPLPGCREAARAAGPSLPVQRARACDCDRSR